MFNSNICPDDLPVEAVGGFGTLPLMTAQHAFSLSTSRSQRKIYVKSQKFCLSSLYSKESLQ